MRAAVVVILATITGIVALLNVKPGSLDDFGAPASASRGAEVVAIPEAEGAGAQPRVRPEVPSRPSRSNERQGADRSGDQRTGGTGNGGGDQQAPLPDGCRVTVDGEELRVTDENNRVVNMRLPRDGTLTIRCDRDGVRRENGEQIPPDQQNPPDPQNPPDQQQSKPPADQGPDPVLPAPPGDGGQDPSGPQPGPGDPAEGSTSSDPNAPAGGAQGS